MALLTAFSRKVLVLVVVSLMMVMLAASVSSAGLDDHHCVKWAHCNKDICGARCAAGESTQTAYARSLVAPPTVAAVDVGFISRFSYLINKIYHPVNVWFKKCRAKSCVYDYMWK